MSETRQTSTQKNLYWGCCVRVFVTGGTGLVGRALVEALVARGDDCVVLTRRPDKARKRLPKGPSVDLVEGRPQIAGSWMTALDGCDAVVNLAGENILTRWTAKTKAEIRDSRVIGTGNLVRAIEQADVRPDVLVSTSAVGYYGDVPEGEITEDWPAADDFLGQVSVAWEQAALAAEPLGLRVVLLRVGVVLSKQGGALRQMLLPFQLGLGGPLAGGQQWMSWIHIDDLVRLYLFALRKVQLRGAVNATAPQPVRNQEFTQALGRALYRPTILPVPGFALRLALGEAAQVAIGGQKVLPQAAQQAGFSFEYPECSQALKDLLSP